MNEHDWNLLNAYLDGELSSRDRFAFEQRLAEETALRAEMESLRATVSLMKLAERIPVPRNFTLDPAKYGQPARITVWDRLNILAIPRAATALGALSTVLMCVGAVLFVSQSSAGTAAAPQAAMMAQEAAAPEEAGGDVAAGAVEAPAEAAEPAAMAQVAEEEAPPSAEDTVRSAAAPTEAASEVGGMGGGASSTGGESSSANDASGGAPPSDFAALPPTATVELLAPAAIPESSTAAADAQPYAKGTDEAIAQEPAPAPVDVEPSAPLPMSLLPTLLVVTGGLLFLVAAIVTLAARRQRP